MFSLAQLKREAALPDQSSYVRRAAIIGLEGFSGADIREAMERRRLPTRKQTLEQSPVPCALRQPSGCAKTTKSSSNRG